MSDRRQQPAPKFAFEHWMAIVANDDCPARGRLRLTDICATPDNNYAFDVIAGTRRVLSFRFDTLVGAVDAAKNMKTLLPRIEAVRWKRPSP